VKKSAYLQCNNLRMVGPTCLLSSYRQSRCSGVIYVRPTVNTVFIDRHCCSWGLMLRPTVWNSLSSFVRTADSFTSFRSQLRLIGPCLQDICSWSAVRASDTLPGLSRVLNSLLTYLLTAWYHRIPASEFPPVGIIWCNVLRIAKVYLLFPFCCYTILFLTVVVASRPKDQIKEPQNP